MINKEILKYLLWNAPWRLLKNNKIDVGESSFDCLNLFWNHCFEPLPFTFNRKPLIIVILIISQRILPIRDVNQS